MENQTEVVESVTIKLGASEHEKSEALGVTLERGFLFWCRPDNEDSIDNSIEHTDKATGETFTEPRNWGYHGNDVPPCAAAYLCDGDESEGSYLVISDSPELPECVDGWSCDLADELEVGWVSGDNTWTLVIVKSHGKGEYTTCGSL